MKVKHLLHCHLLLSTSHLRTTAAAKPLPALKKLLDWSLPPVVTQEGVEGWLCRQFGVARQRDWPTASLAALGAGLNAATGNWLHADPVYLLLLRNRIVLTEEAFSDLTSLEAEALTAILNQHFSADGLEFFAPHHNRWYLCLADAAQINTSSRGQASGADIQQHLPAGPEAMCWHQRLNEMQMLLHEHPVNQAREQHDAMPINSLWLWGGGLLPRNISSPYTGIWSEDVLLMGLAKAAGCRLSRQPASAEAWLEQTLDAGEHLITLEATSDLEPEWFKPMATALNNGQLQSLTLHLTAPHQVQSLSIPRTQCWKFWRRTNPLEFEIHD